MAVRSDGASRKAESETRSDQSSAAASDSTDGSWQERAVDRSINSARLRALARSSAFLAAAMELLEETGDVDFTVQSVVDRSQLSLRAFYQHFGGKDELLISLFEELVTQFTEELGELLEGIDDPYDRLEAYVRGFIERAHLSQPYGGRALTIYQMRLAAERPADYGRSIARQVEVLREIVHRGLERRVFRSDVSETAMTLLLNSTLVSMAQMDVFDIRATGGPIVADEVWKWCRAAVTGDEPAQPTA